MRALFVIFLSLLIQSGLFARLVPAAIGCAVAAMEDCHPGCGSHDCKDHDCPPCPDGEKCPLDGQSHHHHHGLCAHLQPLASGCDAVSGLLPPAVTGIGRDETDSHPPQGPVFELDKPPLI